MKRIKQIPILSFFSGGGFLDIGFEQAGFEIVWNNEFKEAFADMYEAGISSWRASQSSTNPSPAQIIERESIENLQPTQVSAKAFGTITPPFFGVIGGPPCPDFSPSGTYLGANGDRGKLTQVFIDFICQLKPAFFVMENVPGLFRGRHRSYFDQVTQQLELSGYLTDARILSALELGVPQDRQRLFFVGIRDELVTGSDTKKFSISGDSQCFLWPEPLYPNAKSLPWPTFVPFGTEVVAKPDEVPLELSVYSLLNHNVEQLPNGLEAFRPYSKKFQLIAEGDVSGKSFKRLHRYRYSPTAWYGNNEVHLHPWKPRRLTVRETLRIQTVPDEYVLPCDYTLTDKFKMIGNGVPCVLAKHLAMSVKRTLLHYELIDD